MKIITRTENTAITRKQWVQQLTTLVQHAGGEEIQTGYRDGGQAVRFKLPRGEAEWLWQETSPDEAFTAAYIAGLVQAQPHDDHSRLRRWVADKGVQALVGVLGDKVFVWRRRGDQWVSWNNNRLHFYQDAEVLDLRACGWTMAPVELPVEKK